MVRCLQRIWHCFGFDLRPVTWLGMCGAWCTPWFSLPTLSRIMGPVPKLASCDFSCFVWLYFVFFSCILFCCFFRPMDCAICIWFYQYKLCLHDCIVRQEKKERKMLVFHWERILRLSHCLSGRFMSKNREKNKWSYITKDLVGS